MNLFQISTPLLKERKILQVDYFTSKIIQTSRDNFQGWDQVLKVSKQQEKLSRYFQSQQTHNQKYFRFKKIVNQNYFRKQLPEEYKNTVISQTLKGDQFLYSPRFAKMTSSVMMSDSIPLDNSTSDFTANYDAFKNNSFVAGQTQSKVGFNSSIQKRKKSKSISRYWPLEQNFSVILEQEQELPIKSRKQKQTSIYHRSVGKSVQRSFMTMKSRPMSQQITRKSERIKQIIHNSLNPESNPKSIRYRLSTLTQKNKLNQKYKKKQQQSILGFISKQKLLKFLRQSRSIDPKRKGIFSIDDLTDFEKFQMSFIKYMKLKSINRIDKYAFQNKKFQNFILDEFPIDNDSKRKLQKIFENIVWQFKMAQRRKQVQKR